jgi:hypothetical protein
MTGNDSPLEWLEDVNKALGEQDNELMREQVSQACMEPVMSALGMVCQGGTSCIDSCLL